MQPAVNQLGLKWKVEKRKLSELSTWSKNPRRITSKNFERLKERIIERGFHDVLKIDVDGTVLSGNQRLRALKDLGIKEVECNVPERKLTDDERDKVAIESNLNDGEWDEDILSSHFDTDMLDGLGLDMEQFGVIIDPIEPPKGNDLPEPPKEPQSKKGDLYEFGNHRLLVGDSMNPDDIARLMDGKRADMVFQDPPYALFGNSTGIEGVVDDKMVRPFFLGLFRAARSNCKLFGHVYTCCDWHSAFSLQGMARESGLSEKNLIVWDKGDGGIGAMYQHCYEFVWFHTNSPEKKATAGANATGERTIHGRSNIWRFPRVSSSKRSHNAQKPVELVIEAIRNSSEKGEIVLDFFGGSGTTLIAAEAEGRKAFLMECEPKWADAIVQRYVDFMLAKDEKTASMDIVKNGQAEKWTKTVSVA